VSERYGPRAAPRGTVSERAMEAAADAIFVVDAAGCVTDANRAAGRLCGCDPTELVGTALRTFLEAEPPATLVAPPVPGTQWAGELLVRRPTGPPVVRRGTSAVFAAADGALHRCVSVRLASAGEPADRSLRADVLSSLGELAAGLAHEINTPTQYIGDNLGFLLGAYEQLVALAAAGATTEAAAELAYLQAEIPLAVAQSREGIAQVGALVDAFRQVASPAPALPAVVDLNREVEYALTVSRYEWKYVAAVDRALDPGLPLVPCRGGALRQVVLCLVLDAARAVAGALRASARAPGLIAVRTWHDGGSVLLRVRDDGLDRTATDRRLALAREVLAAANGGTIEVATMRRQGTTVTVRLPAGVTA
jgi:signal transduction histidine kinase